ncbi:MAG TPA: nucleotide pyrophosphohydrolase [Burkholderiales bacterium]|nr:nucleotide pyrophosphohydrolase [Burkholderiales bacterium]
MDIRMIQDQLERFAVERDWNKFHSPKNLAMALAGEVGELMEIFQWLTEEQSVKISKDDTQHKAIADELADIAIYTLRLAHKTGVDLETAIWKKIKKNAEKYPIGLSRGNATKYNRRKK